MIRLILLFSIIGAIGIFLFLAFHFQKPTILISPFVETPKKDISIEAISSTPSTPSGRLKEIVEKVVDEFKKAKYINDEMLLSTLLRNFSEYKTYGFYLIRAKLIPKGFSKSLVDKLMEEEFDIDVEKKVAKRFLLKQRSSLEDRNEKMKMANKMKQKGFRTDVIREVLGF